MRLRASGLLLMLLCSMFAVIVLPAVPAHAYTVPNIATAQIANGDPQTQPLTVNNAGDLIVLVIQLHANSGNGTLIPTSSISDSFGDVWSRGYGNGGTFQGTGCGNACGSNEIIYTQATSAGSDSITVTPTSYSSVNGAFEAFDVVGVAPNIEHTADGPVYTGASTTGLFVGTYVSLIPPASVFAVASFMTSCTNGNTLSPGSGFTFAVNGGSLWGGAEYGTPTTGPTSPTDFPATCGYLPGVTNWISYGVVFGAPFTCSITNLDGPNYFVANTGKFYDFFCRISSAAISYTPSPITDVKVIFNDTNTGFTTAVPNVVTMEYDNVTGTTTLDTGGTVATLAATTVVSAYDSVSQVRTMNITFRVALNSNAVNSRLRGIELYAATDINGIIDYVQVDYFNILTSGQGGGGMTSLTSTGVCAVPSGAETFGTICTYGTGPSNSILEKATYWQLQQYQAQFSIQLNDKYGNQVPGFWQNYANSGSGTNPSSNPKDWEMDMGLEHWSNTTVEVCCWVKGLNVIIYMRSGSVGSNNLWTQFQAEWYNDNTLVSNSTFYSFVPTDANGNSQVSIWVNLWYSQDNGSTLQGGEVGAYYTGMHNTGALIWTSWSPLFQNQTQASTFAPLQDSFGKTETAQQGAQLSIVYMNMTRPGIPGVHDNQGNFSILSTNFQEQEFNVASGGMTGIVDPTFAIAVVPTVQSNSIFSPIINAIKSIGTFFGKALVALGDVVWNGLGERFPWFTAALSQFAGLIYSLVLFMGDLVGDFITILKFLYQDAGLVLVPFQIIGSAYGYIQASYNTVFGGANLTAMIEIAVIFFFCSWFFSTLESKNPVEGLVKMASTAWNILDTILYWTWAIAKLLIDSIEGLIP